MCSNVISRNFSIILNFSYIMKFFSNLINYKCWFLYYTNFNYISKIISTTSINSYDFYLNCTYNKNKILNSLFDRYITNYYMSDIYSKNSKVMALCASKTKATTFVSFNDDVNLLNCKLNSIVKVFDKNLSSYELFSLKLKKNKISFY